MSNFPFSVFVQGINRVIRHKGDLKLSVKDPETG